MAWLVAELAAATPGLVLHRVDRRRLRSRVQGWQLHGDGGAPVAPGSRAGSQLLE